MKYLERSVKILVALIVLILLYLSSLYDYLLFHTLAEVFSICIAVAVFLVTWNSVRVIQNPYLLIVGFAYLFIGFMDLMHTISFKGMAIITDYDYHANQVWIAARYFESVVLLVSFLVVKSKKKLNVYAILGLYAVVTAALMLSIFWWHIFPICYIDGAGQTQFKIISEYIIIAILIAAIFMLRKNKEAFDKKVYMFFMLSLISTALSELCFTTYIGNYDFMNLLGHYFKIFSFYFIYCSIVQTGIREPYDLIFREMRQTEQQLYEQNKVLSDKTLADNLTIQQHLDMLRLQYKVLNRQAKMLDLSHEAIFAWDLYGSVFYWNEGAELMYGYTAAEAIGRQSDVLLNSKHPVSLEEKKRILEERGKWFGELVHTTKDGRTLIVEAAHQLYRDEDGRKIVLELCRDVTELRKKQQAISEHLVQLQQQNKQLNRQKKLLDLSNEAIFAWYVDGPIIYWNRGAEKMYGYADDDAVGCQPYQLLKPRVPQGRDALMTELLEKGSWTGYIEHTTRDGRRLTVETHMQVIVNDIGLNTVLETNRDVTEKLKAENAIKKSTVELKNIINSTHDFIWSVDNDYRIIFCNKAVFEFVMEHYGFEMKPGLPFMDSLPPESASAYHELFYRVKTDGGFTVDMHSLRGDKYITYSFHPVYVDSQLVEITVFGRDITQRIKAEQEIIKLNASLETRIHERTRNLEESMETIRNFTMMITHDLKTPLQEIDMYAGELRDKAGCADTADKISGICAGMSAMIAQLIDYDRINKTHLRKEPVDLRIMIDEVFGELKAASGPDTSVLVYQTGLPEIRADKVMMRRVIENLLSNALKFSGKREKPRIAVGCRRENDDYVFYVKDNGVGIDMAYADKLFGVFERLHSARQFEGHGLGLASVRSIISRHGGRTWINGKVDAGTTVYFTLPAAPGEAS